THTSPSLLTYFAKKLFSYRTTKYNRVSKNNEEAGNFAPVLARRANFSRRFWGVPPVFSEECANGLFYCGCKPSNFGSAVVIDLAGLADAKMRPLFAFASQAISRFSQDARRPSGHRIRSIWSVSSWERGRSLLWADCITLNISIAMRRDSLCVYTLDGLNGRGSWGAASLRAKPSG